MRQRHANRTSVLVALLLASNAVATAAGAREVFPTPAEFQRLSGTDTSPTAAVQRFIRSSGLMSGGSAVSQTTIGRGLVFARLLTPLNADFNFAGDPVLAEVVAPPDGSPPFPVGTQLRGFVEGIQRTGRMQRDGELVVKFYEARLAGDETRVSLAGRNQQLAPPATPPSAKQKLRNVLMFSARLAIPLAIGSSGTSLAITTGAGAVIGAVLCDNHRYIQGALRGAWEGSGLSIFDPIVQKGRTLAVPVGTRVCLTVEAPADIPHTWGKLATSGTHGVSAALMPAPAAAVAAGVQRTVSLSTSAQIINPAAKRPSASVTDNAGAAPDSASVNKIKQCLENKDLAKAMQALADVPPEEQQSPAVTRLRDQLLQYVTGASAVAPDSAMGSEDERSPALQIY